MECLEVIYDKWDGRDLCEKLGTPIFEAKIVEGTYYYVVPPLYARKLLKSKHIFKKSKIPGSAQFQGVKSKGSPDSPVSESSLVEALIFPEGNQTEAIPIKKVPASRRKNE